jgi:hypothetical protein
MVSPGRGGHVASSLERAETAVPAPSGVAAVVDGEVVARSRGTWVGSVVDGTVTIVRREHRFAVLEAGRWTVL